MYLETKLGAAPSTSSIRYIGRPAGGLPAGSSLLLSTSANSSLSDSHFCWSSGVRWSEFSNKAPFPSPFGRVACFSPPASAATPSRLGAVISSFR